MLMKDECVCSHPQQAHQAQIGDTIVHHCDVMAPRTECPGTAGTTIHADYAYAGCRRVGGTWYVFDNSNANPPVRHKQPVSVRGRIVVTVRMLRIYVVH